MSERIEYGSETEAQIEGGSMLYIPRESENCPDCGANQGDLHKMGCDVEQCPVCSEQLISCGHIRQIEGQR